jgi:hypothetical protein
MNRFNTNTNYPLINNLNEYLLEQKVVSIHSEDRNITKFPSSSSFEIELPTDYLNVSSVMLGTYAFPANYNTFSLAQANIAMTFKIDRPFNPADHDFFDPVLNATFEALYAHIDQDYIVTISEGFYNPIQIATELTNRLNEIIKSDEDKKILYKIENFQVQFMMLEELYSVLNDEVVDQHNRLMLVQKKEYEIDLISIIKHQQDIRINIEKLINKINKIKADFFQDFSEKLYELS